MKIQCNVCEAAEANVLCCADEAALCWSCDDKVHAANKLASKHHRVPLSNSSSSHIPKCDICQENVGYFFCLEDRALLCRKCDVAIHNANSYVSAHQRFLLTGVKVGLEASEPDGSSTKIPNTAEKMEAKVPQSVCRSSSMSLTRENNEVVSRQVAGIGSASATKISFSGGTTVGSITEWPLDDFLGLSDLSQNSVFMEHGPSKADSGKLGESLSPISLVANEDFEHDECSSKVPEIQWTVPEIPSPPTASGLFWQKSIRNSTSENVASVPDVCCSSPQNLHRYQPTSTALKRRRQY